MVPPNRILPLTLCGALLLARMTAPVLAGSDPIDVSHEAEADFGYVGGATIRGGGTRIGSVDELNAHFKYVLSPQVSPDLLLRFGAEWERFSFGMPEGAPLPDQLQQVSAVIGVDYQLNDHWLARAEIQPGVYSDFEEVTGRDLNAPLLLQAVLLVNADLQWYFGLRIDLRSQYPVIPVAGVSWRFADEWTLDLVLPSPRLEYAIDEQLTVYLGVDLKAGTYKVGDQFGDGNGRPELNHATLDYLEARIGPGVSWKLHPRVTLDVEGGCMVYRRFDYFDRDQVFRSDPAAYFQVACRAWF